MKRSRKTDVLSRPVKLKRPGLRELMSNAYYYKVKTLFEERKRAVEERYGSAPGTLKMALDTMPGFKITWSSDGRPEYWSFARLFYLWSDVQRIAKEKKCSERDACKMLFKERRTEFKVQVTVNKPGEDRLETLWRRYIQAKKSPLVLRMQRLERLGRRPPRSSGAKTSLLVRRMQELERLGGRYGSILQNLLRHDTRTKLLCSDDPEGLVTRLLHPALYR